MTYSIPNIRKNEYFKPGIATVGVATGYGLDDREVGV
jgi:hypothetical protein